MFESEFPIENSDYSVIVVLKSNGYPTWRRLSVSQQS